jgi:hypothetical protein
VVAVSFQLKTLPDQVKKSTAAMKFNFVAGGINADTWPAL